MSISEYLTVSEVAAKLKVTAQSVRTLIKNETLDAERIGSQWVISPAALDKYIADYDVNKIIYQTMPMPRFLYVVSVPETLQSHF